MLEAIKREHIAVKNEDRLLPRVFENRLNADVRWLIPICGNLLLSALLAVLLT